MDSGASDHMCGTVFALQNEYACNPSVTIADGRTMQSIKCGQIMMEIMSRKANQNSVGRRGHNSRDAQNLLSIGHLAKKGSQTSFTEQGASLWKLDDKRAKFVVGSATWDNGL